MKKVVIIGGGISGLATAYLLKRRGAGEGLEMELTLLEKETRVGGKIWSIKDEGYLCEWGPNGFLDSKPQTLELCRQLGATDLVLRSNDNARKRFIYSGGVLHRLPENGPSFLKSRLISWPGKLRLAMELFATKAPEDLDETLAAFGRRRLGEEALKKLIAPMVSGIFAGDPETMSLKSCFPRIAELESEYGSLIMAMIKLAKKKKKEIAEGKAVSSAAGPGGVLTSFRDGIQTLTDLLAARLGDSVVTGQTALRVQKDGAGGYRIETELGELKAHAVILATPANVSAAMVAQLDTFINHTLLSIPYASMTVVCNGFERNRIREDLGGFGYLIPREEGMNTLGTLWDSSIFSGRAPKGKVLLRSMLGGACLPRYIDLSDDEVNDRVQADLKKIMGIKAPPSFIRIYRHQKAIPQYTVGHGDRLTHLADKLKDHPGLFLTGNAYRGIGLNDCVAAAEKCSREAVSYLKRI